MTRFTRCYLKTFFTFLAILTISGTLAYGANVSLRWDPNDPAPEGYRIFIRQEAESYNYSYPVWENHSTTCTLTGLVEGVTYYLVVRAYEGDLESGDSLEISYTPSFSGYGVDTDGDKVPDVLDRFPNDPNEWNDSDNDGVGNNQDPDDDNDLMPDEWEIAHGLDPKIDDADFDYDNDGVSNLDEFKASTNPMDNPDNDLPYAPVIDEIRQAERVDLTPVLISSGYFDNDNDEHYQSQWQISTEPNFSVLVLDRTSTIQLTALSVGELILEVDTQYYWRVRFIDERHGYSQWSENATFTTIPAEESDDKDTNGIPDSQEVDASIDVNEDGNADLYEDDIMTVYSVEGETIIGVETISDNATVVSVKSITTRDLEDQSIQTGFGIIGFKIFLQDGETTAIVKMHFSRQVDNYAKVYKYVSDEGWMMYENAVFAPNRKSVTLVLEDGGVGDEDGVKNGIIVDPSGISKVETLGSGTTESDGGGGGGCFISSGNAVFSAQDSKMVRVSLLLTLIMGIVTRVVGHRIN